ncbi:hypothetical protein SB01124_02659 [Klebsiella quasipneumoniae subsp. quasipneumoniae]|nr:hypothetical protein SB01124_02659 [Klebsiella quasipneumoniae subsp. quasipneumoniae]
MCNGFAAGSPLCYLRLQRSLRSRLVLCVMSLTAQGAHRGRPVAAAPCPPGLRPAPAVSVAQVGQSRTGRTNPPGRVKRSRQPAQNRLRARCPCPPALRLRGPTGSQTRTGRPGKAQPPPGNKIGARARCPCPAALRLRGPTGSQTRTGRPGKAQPPPGTKSAPCPLSLPAGAALARAYWQSDPDR